MVSLIPMDELTTLKSASEVKTVADSAVATIEQQTVAAAINSAANTGQHSITWSKPLSDTLKATLEGLGYTVTSNRRAADPDYSWTISGF